MKTVLYICNVCELPLSSPPADMNCPRTKCFGKLVRKVISGN